MEKAQPSFLVNLHSKFSKAIQSDYFIYLFALFILALSFFDLSMVVLYVTIITLSVIFFTQENCKPAIIPLMFVYYGLKTVGGTFSLNAPLFISIGLFVISIIFYIFYRKPTIRFSPTVSTLTLYGLGFCLSGIGSKYWGVDYPKTTNLYLLALVIVALAFFCFLSSSIEVDKEYLLKTLVVLGGIISLQMFLRIVFQKGFFELVASDRMTINWGGYNGIITSLLFAIPATGYFAVTKKNSAVFFLLLLHAYAVAGFCTGSRASFLILGATVLLLDVYIFFKAENKKIIKTTLILIVVIGVLSLIAVTIIYPNAIKAIFSGFIQSGFHFNGRTFQWEKSKELFLNNSLFGVGMFHSYHDAIGVFGFIWQSHNTYLQALSSLGIVGFLGYLLHSYHKYRSALKNTVFHNVILFIFLATELYGLIDCTYPSPYMLIPLLLILLSLDKINSNKNKI